MPQPWPYQYFPGIIEDEKGRLMYQSGLDDDLVFETNRRHSRGSDEVTAWHFQLIKTQLKATGAGALLSDLLKGRNEEFRVFDQLPNELDAHLNFLESAAALGGIDVSPIASAYLRCLEAGTMACAWVGLPQDEGGTPEHCLRHLAPQRA